MPNSVQSTSEALEEVRKRRLLIDRCDAYLFQQIQPFLGKRILEVGSGHGNLLSYLLDRDLVVATDIDPSSVGTIRRRFADTPNIIARLCDITSPQAIALSQYDFDTVISLNTLEHIEDDRAALRNMAQIVNHSGRVIIIVPAFQFLYGTMDSSIGHFRRYTKSDLKDKLHEAGLQVEKQYYFNLLGVLGWLVNGRLLRRTVAPVSQLRLYNLIFPVASKIESLIPAVIGLSLISIARRI